MELASRSLEASANAIIAGIKDNKKTIRASRRHDPLPVEVSALLERADDFRALLNVANSSGATALDIDKLSKLDRGCILFTIEALDRALLSYNVFISAFLQAYAIYPELRASTNKEWKRTRIKLRRLATDVTRRLLKTGSIMTLTMSIVSLGMQDKYSQHSKETDLGDLYINHAGELEQTIPTDRPGQTISKSAVPPPISMAPEPSKLQMAFNQALAIFTEHNDISALLRAAVQDTSLSLRTIDLYSKQAFRKFAVDFSGEATQYPEAASFLMQHSYAICVSLLFDSVQRSGTKGGLKQMSSASNTEEDIYDSLIDLGDDNEAGILDNTDSANVYEKVEVSGESNSRDTATVLPDFDNEALRVFILTSASLETLLNHLRELLYPPFLSTATRLAHQAVDTGIFSSEEASRCRSRLMALISEISHTEPDKVDLTFHQTVSRIDGLKLAVEEVTRTEWDWWPLAPPRRPLRADEARLVWTCNCGRQRWEDVPQRFGQQLVALVRKRDGSSSGSSSPPPPPPIYSSQTSGPSPALGSDASSPPRSSQAPPGTGSGGTYGQQQADVGNKNRYIFLVVSRDNLRLHQMDATKQGTLEFAQELRAGYRKVRGFWRYWFSWNIFWHCEFVQFEKFCPSVYAHRGRSLPDEEPHAKDYYYHPRPAQSLAPVSIEEFQHIYYHYRKTAMLKLDNLGKPFTVVAQAPWYWPRFFTLKVPSLFSRVRDGHLPADTVPRIPQRFKYFDELGASREDFWGLYARERRSLFRVSMWMVVSMLPWLAFCFVYLFGMGGGTIDLQNATTPLTISMTGLVLLLSWLVAEVR